MTGKSCLLLVTAGLLAAGEQAWKDKPVPEWTESDARQILTDSPWTKSTTAKVSAPPSGQPGSGDGMGTGGSGMPRRGGRGGGIGGRGGERQRPDSVAAPALTVRWESALPVQEAHLKLHEDSAPTVDEGYYTIAVIGLTRRIAGADPQNLESRMKHQGELKRAGRKAIRSSDARVLQREDGVTVLFLFPRTEELSPADQRVEFGAHIGMLELTQIFELGEMMYAAKLEL